MGLKLSYIYLLNDTCLCTIMFSNVDCKKNLSDKEVFFLSLKLKKRFFGVGDMSSTILPWIVDYIATHDISYLMKPLLEYIQSESIALPPATNARVLRSAIYEIATKAKKTIPVCTLSSAFLAFFFRSKHFSFLFFFFLLRFCTYPILIFNFTLLIGNSFR